MPFSYRRARFLINRSRFASRFKPRISTNTKKAVTKIVKSQIKKVQENKHIDYPNIFLVSYAGTIIPAFDVPQGNSDVTRNGDQLTPVSIQYSYQWIGGDSNNISRLIIFRWHPFYVVNPPTPGLILELVSNANAPNSPYVHDQRGNFEVLYDKLTSTNGTDAVTLATSNSQVSYRGSIKMAKKKVQYAAGSTTNAMDNIYILAITDSSATNHPQLTIYTRMNFTDS